MSLSSSSLLLCKHTKADHYRQVLPTAGDILVLTELVLGENYEQKKDHYHQAYYLFQILH